MCGGSEDEGGKGGGGRGGGGREGVGVDRGGYRDMTSIIQIYIIISYQLIYAKPSTTGVTAGWGRYDTTNTYYRIR